MNEKTGKSKKQQQQPGPNGLIMKKEISFFHFHFIFMSVYQINNDDEHITKTTATAVIGNDCHYYVQQDYERK